jgi:hypothetical protein
MLIGSTLANSIIILQTNICRTTTKKYSRNLSRKIVWGALDDIVMGGVSESTFQVLPTGSEILEHT